MNRPATALLVSSLLLLGGCLSNVSQAPTVTTRAVDMAAAPPLPQQHPLGKPSPRDGEAFTDERQEFAFHPIAPQQEQKPPADQLLDLSVEQAVFSALRHNRALVVEQFNPVIANTFVETERAIFDPLLFARGSIEDNRDRSFSPTDSRFFSIDETSRTISGGATTLFPSGTEVSLELSQSRDESENSRTTEEARAGLNVTQALLRGGSVAANLAAIHRAQAAALASAYELRGITENLVASVESAYWDYALAIRQVEIFEESYDLAKRQRDDIHTRITVGQIAETEEVVASAELALRRQQLIDARNDREQARLTLLRLLNPPAANGWDEQITLTDRAVIPEVSLGSPEEHEALAVRLRPELNEARLQARRGELETVQTKNGLLPRLDLFITLGKTGYARSFSGSLEDLDGPGYDFSAGLDFEFPVANRAAQALDRRARSSHQQALFSVENLKQLIALEVRTALLEVERSLQQIDASAARRVLQEEVLRAETVRFRVGTATALDVARVGRDLLESRINEVEAIVNYRQALINLYLLDGTLLLRRGIQGPGAEEVVLP